MGTLPVGTCLRVSADVVWLDYGTVTESGEKLMTSICAPGFTPEND